MAYNNIFPNSYQPMYYPQQYQQPMQPMAQPVQQVQQQVQNGGVVNVTSEKEAREYLVANGTSVTFIDTNNKKIYIKTRGFSQFDSPTFEKYKLVKDEEETPVQTPNTEYANKTDVEKVEAEIEKIKEEINKLTVRGVDSE